MPALFPFFNLNLIYRWEPTGIDRDADVTATCNTQAKQQNNTNNYLNKQDKGAAGTRPTGHPTKPQVANSGMAGTRLTGHPTKAKGQTRVCGRATPM